MAEEMVRCKLRRTFGFRGQYYGPGESVLIPVAMQVALNAQFADATAPEVGTEEKPEPKGKGK